MSYALAGGEMAMPKPSGDVVIINIADATTNGKTIAYRVVDPAGVEIAKTTGDVKVAFDLCKTREGK